MSRKKEPIYAVVRVDKFLPSLESLESLVNCVTVKEVVTTQKLAEEEVARLTKLQKGKNCEYFWQTTRLVTEVK